MNIAAFVATLELSKLSGDIKVRFIIKYFGFGSFVCSSVDCSFER